jgi:hypothetical protein
VTQTNVGAINAWEQDPGSGPNPDGGPILQRPVPDIVAPPFATRILGNQPPADNYAPGTLAFRFWAGADALRRASDFWGGLLGNHKWNPAIDGPLQIILDEGIDLNAYYDRQALNFFHAAVGGRMVYSGESPDIVCHEFGHAVLDAIRPQLWDVAAFEPPAFHESFGDMSALLTALQLPSVRTGVLQETNGDLYQSSRLSRLAEQLGWAIRQKFPDAVEDDCLRNAVNSLFYENPDDLPTRAPSSELSSEPHSLSRVFTAAFFQSLSLMFASSASNPTEADLQRVSVDLGRILLGAIRHSPIVPEYFAQIGSHMVALATAKSDAYGEAVRTAMVKHGILSVPGVVAAAAAAPAQKLDASVGVAAAQPALTQQEIDVSQYGLTVPKISVVMASDTKRFGVAGAALSAGDTTSMPAERAALHFFEDLIRRGRLEQGAFAQAKGAIADPQTVKTHRLEKDGNNVVLRRIRIDCGLRARSTPLKRQSNAP